MWNPTTPAAENVEQQNAVRDNKNKEEVENCRCSVAEEVVCSICSGSVGQINQQQSQQHSFDNSKTQEFAFGGKTSNTNFSVTGNSENNDINDDNIATSTIVNKEENLVGAETVDSGFISGPQTELVDENPDKDNKAATKNLDKNFFTVENNRKTVINETNTVQDSGCIDSVYEYSTEVDIEAETEVFKAKNCVQQVEDETLTITPPNTAKKVEQMKFKYNVDASMSEWMVKLDLQNATNNLNAAVGRRGANSVSNVNPSRQAVSALTATVSSSSSQPELTQPVAVQIYKPPPHAWEQFYQQNDDGDTALHLACIAGYIEVIIALIRMAPHPCLFNIQNDEAQTPLHLAALTAQPNILRILLLAGAEPTVRDRHGNTALHLVCISGEKQCVRALTETLGASEIHEAHRQYGHRSNDKALSSLSYARLPSDLEIRNYDGERCVHLAAQAGHIDILRILVSHGADINAREGKSGRTPLHIAIECRNEDLANFLLDECEKINLETATYAGLTAYQVAQILNNAQMQNILQKRGAEPLTPPDSDYDNSDIEEIDDPKIYDLFGDPRYFRNYNGGNPMTVA